MEFAAKLLDIKTLKELGTALWLPLLIAARIAQSDWSFTSPGETLRIPSNASPAWTLAVAAVIFLLISGTTVLIALLSLNLLRYLHIHFFDGSLLQGVGSMLIAAGFVGIFGLVSGPALPITITPLWGFASFATGFMLLHYAGEL